MKTLLRCLLMLVASDLALPAAAQQFPVDTLIKTGPLARRINLVFVPDGYQASEMPLFISRVNQAVAHIFGQSPLQQYRSYFNVFAIKVPSAASDAQHPRTASDCGTIPAVSVNTYFGSTYDFGGIHRLLVPQRTAELGSVLAASFPDYDQVFVLVNSADYGGAGGQFATASANAAATEIAIHEIGHSFAGLSDEYWAGAQYARESANMTRTTDPATVRWASWMGTRGVGIYSHTTNPAWKKPHENCKMQALGSPFCTVCQEAFVERIHTLASPLLSYAPLNLTIESPQLDPTFSLSLLAPEPNTLKVTWTLDDALFARKNATMTVPLVQLPPGTHKVRAVVTDTTALTRSGTHLTQHSYAVEWTVSRSSNGLSMSAAAAAYQIETFPNPVTEVLHLTYVLPRPAPVSIAVLDAAGRTVRTIQYKRQAAGRYQYQLQANELGLRAAGTYTLLLNVDGVPMTRQLVRE